MPPDPDPTDTAGRPRTWTLKRFAPSIGGGRETRVRGAILTDGEEAEVIELEPVLALLQRADTALMYADSGEEELRAEIDALLRKHRRSSQ